METAQASASKNPGPGRELRHYISVLRKRWPAVAALLVLATVGTVVWTMRQPRIYEASCSIIIEANAPQVLEGVKDVIEMGPGGWMYREFSQTQFRIILSRENAQRVIDRLALQHDPSTNRPEDGKGQVPRQDIVSRLLRQVKVVGVRESRIANITVSDTDPERATRIANAFADTYIERNLDYKLEGARTAGSWLGEQTVDLRKRLEASELELYKFKKERNLLDVGLDDKLGM